MKSKTYFFLFCRVIETARAFTRECAKRGYTVDSFSASAPAGRHAPGGGGGTQIWFRRGCAAGAAKPILAEKGTYY